MVVERKLKRILALLLALASCKLDPIRGVFSQ